MNVISYEKSAELAYEYRVACLETMVKDQMMDALVLGDKAICQQFEAWLLDDSRDFIREVLAVERDPDGFCYLEVLDKWRQRWVDWLVAELGWQGVSNLFDLEIEA